ncbi:transporter [Photobacterium sp. 1_MG-2023]|uniref:transporter n=1 Tax=Photobacterium sp. 1_MG-2023 TaxID=3062646 RepID=UPI0026E1C623|nr:transporter [Photobacterium sp. 1_MG-2023]MDO6705615.1 transporter [Photobacterium sp. 1_MG-2023]
MKKLYSQALDSATTQSNTQGNARTLLIPIAIFMAVAVIAAVAAFIIQIEVLQFSGNLGEDSLVEYTQEMYLALSSALFAAVAVKKPALRGFAILVSAFFLVLLIRELDGVLDLIQHGFWKVPAVLVAVGGIAYAYQHPQSTQSPLRNYSKHASFGLMIGGMATLMVFSRLFGMGDLWQTAMQDNYVREVKNLAEEGVELLGYSLILAASAWYCLPKLVSKKQ